MTRNLAYIALLAGWLCFCYWLYADGIAPRLKGVQETSWPPYAENMRYPLAYTWASAEPLSGEAFGDLKSGLERLDSTDEVLVIKGYFFMDEMEDLDQNQHLAHSRIDNVLEYLDFDKRRIITTVEVQAVNADVRANPFEAIHFERIRMEGVLTSGTDTFELCFPVKDSIALPPIVVDRFLDWVGKASQHKDKVIHLTGIADGGGIAESAEIALERAIWIKEILLEEGWNEDKITISSGQRNHLLSLRNRCVVIYFE